MEMVEFSSDNHYIYYCGQESLRRSEVALRVNTRAEMQYLGAISRPTELSVCFEGKPFNIIVIQVYAPTTSAKEEEWFYEDLYHLLELTHTQKMSFSS